MLSEFILRFALLLAAAVIISILISRKRVALKIVMLVFLAVIVLYSSSLASGFSSQSPSCYHCNVVLIVPEVLRRDAIGLYSGVTYTPSIDSFFSDSYIFTNFYGSSSWTLPSHASLLTGLYPNHHKANENNSVLSPEFETIQKFFQTEGYYTVSLNGGGFAGPSPGFTRNFNYSKTIGDIQGNTNAIKYQLSLNKNRSFFMLISSFDMHWPYDYSGKFVDSLNYSGPLLNQPIDTLSFYNAFHNSFFKNPMFAFPNGSVMNMTQSDVNYVRATYYQQAYDMDSALNDIFYSMEKDGLLNNTVVVLMSDHGEDLLGHWVGHATFYDGVIHTPFMMRVPGFEGKIVSKLASNVDVFPTLAAILGFKPPSNIDGINLFSQSRKYAFAFSNISPHNYMVTDGAEKLILENLGLTGDVELYNLKNDPNETNNLASTQSVYSSNLYKALTKDVLG